MKIKFLEFADKAPAFALFHTREEPHTAVLQVMMWCLGKREPEGEDAIVGHVLLDDRVVACEEVNDRDYRFIQYVEPAKLQALYLNEQLDPTEEHLVHREFAKEYFAKLDEYERNHGSQRYLEEVEGV